jgi:5-methyltetrahydropteroyltriglutamate--homocysteine methyltransferase
MIQSTDAGSLPFQGDLEKFLLGVASFGARTPLPSQENDSNFGAGGYFEEKITKGFLDKINAGINIPNYPQFRDMNEMFLRCIDGIEKTKDGYVAKGNLSIQTQKVTIPEVAVLAGKSGKIHNTINNPISLKICVTGPYTLSSLFLHRGNELLRQLGEIISQIVDANILSGKNCNVELVSIDEPVFGLLDDPQLDYASDGREALLDTWENIFQKARSKHARTCLHLHNTSNALFWEVRSLDILESHADDSLYHSDKTKKLLEEKDKFLKASVGITDFDRLIRDNARTASSELDDVAVGQRISSIWTDIHKGRRSPMAFLETAEKMKERLAKVTARFGSERVPYAGLECGLRGFPTYDSAIEYLRRSSESVGRFD